MTRGCLDDCSTIAFHWPNSATAPGGAHNISILLVVALGTSATWTTSSLEVPYASLGMQPCRFHFGYAAGTRSAGRGAPCTYLAYTQSGQHCRLSNPQRPLVFGLSLTKHSYSRQAAYNISSLPAVQMTLVQVCPGFTGNQCNVDDEPAQSVVRILWASALQVLVFTCKACCQANKTDTPAAEPATTYDWLVIGKPNSAIAVRLLTTFRACSSSRFHWTPVQHR